jgi:malic enzyme
VQALADCVSEEQLEAKRLYPEISDLREVSAKVRVWDNVRGV